MSIHLTTLDWGIILGVLACTFVVGLSTTRKASKGLDDFFVGNRSMPWWLLGISMVATTFDTNVPNLVTNIVRENGVSGNWIWFGMLPSGALAVFLYARLWRRSGAVTDLEFYEKRYSGKLASFLRGFRAVYLGVGLNVLVMATTILAAIKTGGILLGLTPWQSVSGALILTGIFSAAGGLQGVLFSDFLLFIIAMIGSVAAAFFAVAQPGVGGLAGMVEKLSAIPEQSWKLNLFQFHSWSDMVAMFIVPLTVIWWSVWYMGAEPGGGGFLVQRMLSAKNEKNAIGATLLFQIVHYAVRPWPWFIVALSSLVIYPDRGALCQAVGTVLPENQIQSDVAYSLMLTKLPPVWAGIVIASLIAAFISTISTLLNWGASYLVKDVYSRFLRKTASDKELVNVARFSTIVLLILSSSLALCLQSALSGLQILLAFGAGTGLVYMLRWFWWRINAESELVAMITASFFAIYFNVIHPRIFPNLPLSSNMSLLLSILATTICWLIPVFWGPKTDKQRLYEFCRQINPPGPGWKTVRNQAEKEGISLESNEKTCPILPSLWASIHACFLIYSLLFAIGEMIYGRWGTACLFLLLSLFFTWLTCHILAKEKKCLNVSQDDAGH